jgi:hypothetical protein
MRRASDGRWTRTRFGAWIAKVSVRRIVQELARDPDTAITRAEVYAWVAGKTAPRPRRALALVSLSHGALALEDVFGHREVVNARRDRLRHSAPAGMR